MYLMFSNEKNNMLLLSTLYVATIKQRVTHVHIWHLNILKYGVFDLWLIMCSVWWNIYALPWKMISWKILCLVSKKYYFQNICIQSKQLLWDVGMKMRCVWGRGRHLTYIFVLFLGLGVNYLNKNYPYLKLTMLWEIDICRVRTEKWIFPLKI